MHVSLPKLKREAICVMIFCPRCSPEQKCMWNVVWLWKGFKSQEFTRRLMSTAAVFDSCMCIYLHDLRRPSGHRHCSCRRGAALQTPLWGTPSVSCMLRVSCSPVTSPSANSCRSCWRTNTPPEHIWTSMIYRARRLCASPSAWWRSLVICNNTVILENLNICDPGAQNQS